MGTQFRAHSEHSASSVMGLAPAMNPAVEYGNSTG
ncbi:hypothetical protein FB001_1096 [Ensifer sp. SEMIA 135]|nr:hypothetical protein SinmeB_5380 [Sinorhizobium meliloti BL225C]AGA08751.1 hypothetical protein C770_GR4pC0010 [Sinorhizobium meliloti GR4]TWB00166.1 hypothetical protein FB000_1106 [Ensifer sp. SEMIA 134]TWB34921.1 hypothetical protein FB001_1096 [Ensifer sp. SEMIA 135]